MLNACDALPIKTAFMSDEAAACTHVHNCRVLLEQVGNFLFLGFCLLTDLVAASPPPLPPRLVPLPLLFLLHVAFTKARYRVEEETM